MNKIEDLKWEISIHPLYSHKPPTPKDYPKSDKRIINEPNIVYFEQFCWLSIIFF